MKALFLRNLVTARPTVGNAGECRRIPQPASDLESGRKASVSPHSPGKQNQRSEFGDDCQDAHAGDLPLPLLYRLLH